VLLRKQGESVLAIGQPSHSWISGQLARAWGNERFGAVEPFEEVCLAAEQHDLGMGPWDSEPELNPETGLPYSFTEMPVRRHIQQWTDGPRRLSTQSRYAALLASLHGARLQRRRNLDELTGADASAVCAYLAEQHRFQEALIRSLKADRAQLDRNHQLLWIWDYLSLALCLNWGPTTAHEVPTAAGAAELELSPEGELAPWPFAAPTLTVRCEGRRLTGPYAGEDEMRAALTEAPWETLEFKLVRA
jgi:uncharacterized protein DUF3891